MGIKHIPTEDKVFFLRWFLKTHTLKEPEFKNYLTYLINNSHLLEKIHFTQEVKRYKQTLIMATEEFNGSPVIYRYKNSVHLDKGVAFKYINHYSNECDLFIKLDYPDSSYCEIYSSVLADDLTEVTLSNSEIQELNLFLEYNSLLWKKQFLLSELDDYLDKGDKEMFHSLSFELKEITSLIESFLAKK